MEEVKQQFLLLHIVTIEASFKREVVIDENYRKAISDINLNLSKSFEGDKVSILLKIKLKQTFEGKDLVVSEVACVGVFQKNSMVDEKGIETFCDINGPAIIFPFVRENIASMSMKAGLQPILIQPINFVELAKQNKLSKE